MQIAGADDIRIVAGEVGLANHAIGGLALAKQRRAWPAQHAVVAIIGDIKATAGAVDRHPCRAAQRVCLGEARGKVRLKITLTQDMIRCAIDRRGSRYQDNASTENNWGKYSGIPRDV